MQLFHLSQRITRLGSILFLTIIIWTTFQIMNTTITIHAQEIEPPSLTVCPDGGDFTSIQPAIDAIASGGTISLCSAMFPENISINKSLTLRGTGSDTTTIIPYDNTAILISPDVDVTIEDLGITTSTTECCGPSGNGIDNEGKLLIRRVDIYDNARGLLNRAGEVDIVLSTIRENNRSYFRNDGSGVRNENGIMRISQSTIWGNSMSGPDEDENNGAGVWNDGTITITNSAIRNNAGAKGGGIYNNFGDMTIEDSSIASNVSVLQGAGIYNDDTLSIARTTIEENSTALPNFGGSCIAFGGGIANYGVTTMTDSLIKSNRAGDDPDIGNGCFGGGIFTHGGFSATNLTIIDNMSSRGAGIYVEFGALVLKDSTILDNYAGEAGAGILNEGRVTFLRTIISGNRAFATGAGILNRGQFEIVESSIRQNHTFSIGAGISNSGPMTIKRSAIHDNYSDDGSGAGIFNSSALTVTNSTVSNNEAPDGRGVGITTESGTVRIVSSTITNNKSRYQNYGSGINNRGGSTVYLQGSIISDNTINNDVSPEVKNCEGDIISLGSNIANDDSCTLQAANDQPSTDPRIGPLQDNGGSTATLALLSDSPAIDTGSNINCPETDQRGIIRPQGAGCDIGAFELEDDGPPPVTCGPLIQEGEDGTLFGKFAIGDDPNASGGQYVSVPERQISAAGLNAPSTNRKNRADYCFTVTEAGDYRVRTQVLAPDNKSNSFLVQVDGAPKKGTLYDIFPTDGTYVTDYVSQRGDTDPVIYTLEPGDHTISFILREDGARLDSFALEPATVQAANITIPTEVELRKNLGVEGEAPEIEPFIFVPLITR